MGLFQRLFSRDKRIEKKRRAYQPLIPPFDKPPIMFSAAEAKQYFNWYMEHIDERCDYIIEKAASGLGCSKSVFDYSFDSLIPLWRWFLSDVETEVRSRERAEFIHGCYGQNAPKMDFFADLINDHRDEPLLMGVVNIYDRNGQRLAKPYKLDFEPIHMAGVQAVKALKKTANERALYDISMIHMSGVDMARILMKEQQEMDE